jgi:hypothetical protein
MVSGLEEEVVLRRNCRSRSKGKGRSTLFGASGLGAKEATSSVTESNYS